MPNHKNIVVVLLGVVLLFVLIPFVSCVVVVDNGENIKTNVGVARKTNCSCFVGC